MLTAHTSELIRAKFTAEGAESLDAVAGMLENEAARLDDLARSGLTLDAPIADDYGDVVDGEDAPFAAPVPPNRAVYRDAGTDARPNSLILKWSLDGCATLSECAARLRANAGEFRELHRSGYRLTEPVQNGRAGLALPDAGE